MKLKSKKNEKKKPNLNLNKYLNWGYQKSQLNELLTIKEVVSFQNEITHLISKGIISDPMNIFAECLFYPYKLHGNQYVSGFENFYELISNYKFYDGKEDYVLLFRGMGDKEFNLLKDGVKSPSWSNKPNICTKFTILEILNGNSDDSKLCWGLFKKEDIIISELQFNLESEENEFWVRKNTKPLEFGTIYSLAYEDLEIIFNRSIDELTVTHRESLNGHHHMSTLHKRGVIDKASSEKLDIEIKSKTKNGLAQFKSKILNNVFEKYSPIYNDIEYFDLAA